MAGLAAEELKPAGPLHAYDNPPEADRLTVSPLQYGPLLLAVATGISLMITFVVSLSVHPSALVTITVYVPLLTAAEDVITGLASELLNPLGPTHE